MYPIYGLPGLVVGVVLGSLLHVAVQVPSLATCKVKLSFIKNVEWKYIKEVVKLSIPRTFTLAANQLSMTAMFYLASFMAVGSISILTLSFNLQSVPLAIIGVSYSLAAFPVLTRLHSEGKRGEFISHIITAGRHIIFWSIPVTVLFVVLRAQIVRVIFGSGNFNWDNTRLTAASLALFAISVTAQSLVLLFVRGFYSAGMTKKPLLINTVSSILAVVFAILGFYIFNAFQLVRDFFEILLRVSDIPGTSVLVLPLGFTLASIINMVWLWRLFEKDFRGFGKILKQTFFQSFGASVVMGYVAYLCLNIFTLIFDQSKLWGIFLQGFFAGIIGILVAVIILYALKNEEVKEITKTLQGKIWKVKTVVPEQIEL